MSRNFHTYVEERKNKVNVLVLGPYRPQRKEDKENNPCLKRLIKIRDYLREKGFLKTFLVADFPDLNEKSNKIEKEHDAVKSYFYLREWAEICLFIFLRHCDNSGVQDEFNYVIYNVKDKINSSTIIYPEDTQLSGLIKGKIQAFRIRVDSYQNDNEIEGFAFNSSYQTLFQKLMMQ